jgi:putative endonuclease
MADERPRAGPVPPPRRRSRQDLREHLREHARGDHGQRDSAETTDKIPPDTPSAERQVAFRTGISAESRAAAFLIAKGFRILARRWRSPVGEIDIIARRRTLLIFVEVKARANLDDAAWSVTERQRQRIAAAAEVWLAHNPDARIRDIRFDAMLVAPGRIPRHITAAFDASN